MGGVVKGAFNVVKSVAKFGVNMVKSVIKNPLPVIATIGLSFAAPGIASAMGLSKTFGAGLGKTIVNGIGRAAISAATGGNLSSIVAAGITPFFNSPEFSKALSGLGGGSVGNALTNITDFVSKPLTAVFGDALGSVFTGALGDSSVAGLVAAVTGQDIVKAMGSEFATSVVSAGLARSWNALKAEVPRLLQSEADIEQKALDAKIMKDTTPSIGKVESLQYSLNKNITEANALLEEYNAITTAAENANRYADLANNATNQEDFDFYEKEFKKYEAEYNSYPPTRLDELANTINQLYVPSINEEKALLEAEYNANKSVIDDYISKVNEVGQLNKGYELGIGKVLGETTDLKMNNAIAQGDFIEASKFYNELEAINKNLLEIDPSAITVAPSIDLNSQNLLRDIYSASDETLKNQLIAQANLNQQFNDIRTNAFVLTPTPPTVPETPAPAQPTPEQPSIVDAVAETPTPTEPTPTQPPVQPTPTQPTIPVTPVQPTPVTPVVPETPPTDDRAPGYADLPTLPEGGIGQPAPPAPTTPITPPSGSNTIGNIIGGVGNAAGNVLQNALIGAGTNAIVNEILGNEPPRRPPPVNKPRPPSKVDVSTLTPFTGTLPSGLAPTGGLPTNTTQTPTQTPNSGLTSTTQPKTPPTKVDVSTLTPVTDTNWLKSLGIVQG